MPSTRAVAISLLAGLLHAAGLLAVALELGYTVGPAAYSMPGLAWRYGGLVVVAAVPVWLALRHRILTPLVALVLTTGYVLGTELAPPGPTFRDLAEVERLAEPTGITVVENCLFIVRYMVNASVWTIGFLLLSLLEYATRTCWDRLPDVPTPVSWLPIPPPRRRAATVATVGGVVHAIVMTWFAVRLGVTVTGGSAFLLYGASVVSMWLLAAVPLYLLVRHRLVAPTTGLTAFVLLDARAEFSASVDDPHALYCHALGQRLLIVIGVGFALVALAVLGAGVGAPFALLVALGLFGALLLASPTAVPMNRRVSERLDDYRAE